MASEGITPGPGEPIPATFEELEAAFDAGFIDGAQDPSADGGEGEVGPSPVDLPDPTAEADDTSDDTDPADDEPSTDGFAIADDGGPDLDDPPPPEPDLPPAASVDLNEVLSGYLGRAVQADDARGVLDLMQFANDVQSLPLDAQQAIAEIMQSRQAPSSPAGPAAAAPQPPPTAPPAYDDPWADDPAPAPTVDPRIEAELAEMRAWRAQQETAAAQQQQQWVAAEAKLASDDFVSSAPVPLTESELIVLERKAVQSGEFGLEMQRTGGTNPREAWRNTLERAFWADEKLRQRVIDNQAADAAKSAEADQTRQRKAASVSAGGGAVPSPAELTAPVDMREALNRASADVAKLMNSGQPPG